MKSIWKQNINLPDREALNDNIKVQNVVIGAGMAGILTAWFLQKKGQEVIVVEADCIAGGQTGNTTAKITSQHALFYDKMIRLVGREQARLYADANEQAIRSFEQIIREENIDCHFEKKPAYLYTCCEEGVEELRRELEAVRSLGTSAVWIDETSHMISRNGRNDKEGEKLSDIRENLLHDLPFPVKAAICVPNQAQFHPLEFIKHLAEELTIYEHTKVLSVKQNIVYTEKGYIKAENIIFATHYPITNIPGFYFLRQHQERSYALALANQTELKGMYYGIDEGGLSLRSAGDMLLLGGGSHRTGKCKCEQRKGKLIGYFFLKQQAKVLYPDAEIAYYWSAQDCMPHDEIPLIGTYSVFRPQWYVATGFKKWGMTTSIIAAQIISDKICGTFDGRKSVFTPQRIYFRAGIMNLLIDIGESVAGLAKGLFAQKERRCRHMGCKLDWNPQESSWECSCHGSGYYKDGRLKDNPAQRNLK